MDDIIIDAFIKKYIMIAQLQDEERKSSVTSEKFKSNHSFTLLDLQEFIDDDQVKLKYILTRNPLENSKLTEVEDFQPEIINSMIKYIASKYSTDLNLRWMSLDYFNQYFSHV